MSARMMRIVSDSDSPAAGLGAEALPTASAATLVNGEVRAAATAVTAWFTHEDDRRHADWRRTVTGVRDALAGLDRSCEAALHTLTGAEAEPAAALSTLVDTLVAAASVHADAAAERARAELRLEIADLQALVDGLHAELDAARAQVQIAREESDEAQRARGRAEAARDEAQRAHAQLVAASEAQRQSAQAALDAERAVAGRLRQQVEAAHEENARLIAALHTVQRAVSFADAGAPAIDLPRPLPPPEALNVHLPADCAPDVEPESSASQAPPSVVEVGDPAVAAAPPVIRTLTLVSPAPAAAAEAHFEPVLYLKHLFEEIELMYGADLDSALSAVDVAAGLAANLGYAREVFKRRLGSAGVEDTMLFERQLTIWLETKSATSFGHQLAIAASESGLMSA